MELNVEALNLCKQHGGFWVLVKTPKFKFFEKNVDVLLEILHELNEYRFCKRLCKERILGVNGEPPLRTKEQVKKYLDETKVKVPENATEQQLRKLLYDEDKIRMKKDIKNCCIKRLKQIEKGL